MGSLITRAFWLCAFLGVLIWAGVASAEEAPMCFGSIDYGLEGATWSGSEVDFSADIDMNGNLIYDSTSALDLGTAAATGHSLATGDVIFGADIEIDGVCYADGSIEAAGGIDMKGATITDTGQVLELGVAAASTHSLAANDTICGGAFEVDGAAHFDSTVDIYGGLDANGTVITDTTQTLQLGTSCVTSHALAANSICVGDGAEFDGTAYFDSTAAFDGSGLWYDNKSIVMGSGNDSIFTWRTTPNPDALVLALGTDSRNFYIVETGDQATAFTLAQQTNPTLVIQSADATTEAQRLMLAHDQTNGVITVGTGALQLGTGTNLDAGTNIITDGAQVLELGVACASSHSLASGAICVGDGAEFNGNVFFDGATFYADNTSMALGAGSDALFTFRTSTTPDSLMLTVGTESRNFYLVEKGDQGTDFALAQQTNPTLVIQSSDATSVNQRIFFAHNQTDGVIDVGAGDIELHDNVKVTAPEITSSGTNDYSMSITQTLNDSGAGGGSDTYYGIKADVTQTDVTGWDNLYLMDLQADSSSVFRVSPGEGLEVFDSSGNGFYWHEHRMDAAAVSPGGSGATLGVINTATITYLLDATNEYLYFTTDIETDWDGSSDIVVEVYVSLAAAETANDIINAEVIAEYNGEHDDMETPKTQTRTINHDIVNWNGQGDIHELHFLLDHDLASHNIDVGDIVKIRFRLDSVAGGTDVAGVRFLYASLKYRTSHPAEEIGTFPSEG